MKLFGYHRNINFMLELYKSNLANPFVVKFVSKIKFSIIIIHSLSVI